MGIKNLSLRIVVIGGVILGLLVPMSIGTFYGLSKQKERLLTEAADTHSRLTQIMALGVQKALWDLSPEGAEPMVKSALDDHRVARVAIFDTKGEKFFEGAEDSRKIGDVISKELPIKNGEEVIGKVVVDFSMASAMTQIQERMIEAIILSAIQALFCIGVLVVLLNSRILSRVLKIKTQAEAIALKKLDTPFEWHEKDEIGVLGQALETTRAALKALFSELEKKNADLAVMNQNLEGIVEERTATIKMILDNVRSGFVLVDKNLVAQDGFTKSCFNLFGATEISGKSIMSLLKLNTRQSEHFKGCVDQVFEDIFPEDVSLDQIPRRVKMGDRSISIEGATIRSKSGEVLSILFTVVDVTALEKVEQENRTNRAMVRIMQNIGSFQDFIKDCKGRIESSIVSLKSGQDAIVRRELHTLKGNSSAFGLDEVAHLIHGIEDEAALKPEHIAKIEGSFKSFLEHNFDLLKLKFGQEPEKLFQVNEDLLATLKSAVRQSPEKLAPAVEHWIDQIQKVPAMELLGPLQSYVSRLAEERGKAVQFKILGGQVRVDKDQTSNVIQNLVHLIRNSIDHGLELPQDRGDKSIEGKIELEFRETPENLTIELRDDGKGIDVERVAKRALSLGHVKGQDLEKLSDQDKLNLIFVDGLSTADSLSETSGRGVGATSVKQAVAAIDGKLEVITALGKGTTFKIVMERKSAAPKSLKQAA